MNLLEKLYQQIIHADWSDKLGGQSKMAKLKKFEVLDHCKLNEFQIKRIKENLEEKIQSINERLEKGADKYTDRLIESHCSELYGMQMICATVGIRAEHSLYKDDESVANG